jgi:hypothetical protein
VRGGVGHNIPNIDGLDSIIRREAGLKLDAHADALASFIDTADTAL